MMQNYRLTTTVFQGTGQFSDLSKVTELSFDIEAPNDHAARITADNELDNHYCLAGMTKLYRVEAAGNKTVIAEA